MPLGAGGLGCAGSCSGAAVAGRQHLGCSDELAVDRPQQPGGAGVVAAGAVDAGEGVLGHSEL